MKPTKNLLKDLNEKEQKLLCRIPEDKDDVQLIAADGFESNIFLGATNFSGNNLIIGYVHNEVKSCKGMYGGRSIQLTPDTGLIRVIVDERELDDIRYHVHCNGSYVKLSENTEDNDALLIMFVETPLFIQFTLYDGQLNHNKISHIFTTKLELKPRIRSIAYSILGKHFNTLHDTLKTLDADSDAE